MCGITGFIDLWNTSNTRRAEDRGETLDAMCRVIRHRGPDDQGVLLQPGVALGMRRLSIIDLAGGHQPISNEDNAVTIVFNGEIYNYRELQKELQSAGHRFRTNSDTETIVHAYEEFGPSCVEHLRGMFAFAIWDQREKKVFIARDRVGKKPLYYSVTSSGTLVFGSELKSLLEHPEVERKINPQALDAYFSLGYVPDPISIFENVEKLPPGHHLTFTNGRLVVERYWDFSYDLNGNGSNGHKASDYLDELRALLDEAVKLRLVSDVPLGAFLSGGIDSSTVVGLMARHMD